MSDDTGRTGDRGPAEMTVQRRIEWPDTDASGHYHNTAAFRFVEVAETALLERLGMLDDVYGRVPRAHVEADFHALLWFRDVVDIRLWVERVGTTSVTYGFEMSRAGERCVSGSATAVLLGADRKPEPWPDDYRRLLLTSGPQAPELLVEGRA